MHKLLIIDDARCSEALDSFLFKHQDEILLLMDIEDFDHKFESIINDLRQLYKLQRKSILKTPEGLRKVPVADIMYVQMHENPSQLIFNLKDNNEILVFSDLCSVEKDLAEFNFIRVNENSVLNPDYLSQYISEDKKCVLMENGEKILVDSSRENVLMELLNKWK
jgi:DNA-binding LytR/AlgR family response regulator